MHTIKFKAQHAAWKVKKDPTERNPWTRKIPYTCHLLHDEERRPVLPSPSTMPELPIISTPTFDGPLSLPPLLPLTSHHALDSVLSPTRHHNAHEARNDLVEPPDTFASNSSDIRQQGTNPALLDGLASGEGRLSRQELPSEYSTLVSREDAVDDLNRDIDIIIECGNHECTYRYKMLIDSGNSHANLISSKVVDDLRIPRAQTKPSFTRRVLNKLAPWTHAGMAAQAQSRSQIRNIDGTVIGGQGATVTISWFGKNQDGSSDPILWFQPRRYETTHVVVDANIFNADIILSWKEVKSLRLRQRFTGAIYRPPTPKSDPDDERYRDYEKRRAENAAAREAARNQEPGQSQSSSAGSTRGSGK